MIRFAISLIMVDIITIIMSLPGQWLECLGSAVQTQRKYMPWNAKCMTFGGISHLHFDKTRELIEIESPSSILFLPWAPSFCQQEHQTAAVTPGRVSAPSCLPYLCEFIRGKLTSDIGRVSVLHKYLHFSSAGRVWSTNL